MTASTPLPPGQMSIGHFPRFGTHLSRPAPVVPHHPVVEVTGAVTSPVTIAVADLAKLPRREVCADFHCVAGWTARGLRWEGVPFAVLYREVVEPVLEPGATVTHVVFGGLDGHESALLLEDALAPDVLVADRLDGRPLDPDHGAPARLVSPGQYGYMSTKHLCRIEVRTSAPRRLGAAHPLAAVGLRGPLVLRHPRARVWEEERHPFLPAVVLRPLYHRIIPRRIRSSTDDAGPRRLTDDEHRVRPWRVHEVTGDFRVEDVWELPGTVDGEGFGRLVERLAAVDLASSGSAAVRLLVGVRVRLGGPLGLDRPAGGAGERVASLRGRLPADLRDGPRGPRPAALPASPLFLTDDEWALELANATVHGVLHVGRVPVGGGRSRVRLAVLVKPNGVLGDVYMAAIRPFRHHVVYPSLLRDLGAGLHDG